MEELKAPILTDGEIREKFYKYYSKELIDAMTAPYVLIPDLLNDQIEKCHNFYTSPEFINSLLDSMVDEEGVIKQSHTFELLNQLLDQSEIGYEDLEKALYEMRKEQHAIDKLRYEKEIEKINKILEEEKYSACQYLEEIQELKERIKVLEDSNKSLQDKYHECLEALR